MKYKFRDKLILAFALLLLITVVPILVMINSQIESISAKKIEEDLRNTRKVFERFQENQLSSYSQRAGNFILTQSEVRAEIATLSGDAESMFGDALSGQEEGGENPDPFDAAGEEGEAESGMDSTVDSALDSAFNPAAEIPSNPCQDPSGEDPFGAVDAGGSATFGVSQAGASQEGVPEDGVPEERKEAGDTALAAMTSRPLPQGDGGTSPEGKSPAEEALGTEELPPRQNLVLSIVEEVGLYQESEVFFLTDYRGELIFNKPDPSFFGVDLSVLPDVLAALQGNEIFTWWGSRHETIGGLNLLPGSPEGPRLFQTFLKPVLFGPEVKGLIAIGFALREQDLRKIAGITQSEIAFIANGTVYLNSREDIPPASLLALISPAAKAADGAEEGGLRRFEHQDEDFLALPVAVNNTQGDQVGSVIVYRSQTREMLVYDNLKWILNVIGIAALALAGLLAYLISHNVSLAVRALSSGVDEVRRGNLDHRLDIRSRDEFGELSDAFNEMTAGLKEKEQIRDTFKRYVSSTVVDELLQNADEIRLGGETKSLTIQFSDIAGFTSISEAMRPEEVVEFLNEYLTEMTSEIEEEHGIVDKYIGDAIMAFWGAPLALDNPAQHGCRAALRQMRKLASLKERWRGRSSLENFSVRIGVHTGEVVVGNIGSATRMDYTIIGDNVNTASRLEGMNKIYGTDILATEQTVDRVGDEFVFRELDLIRAVGKSIPIRIYELAGFSEERNPALMEAHDRFREGLALYRSKKFSQAAKVFQALLKSAPDGAAQEFLNRCQQYEIDPPPEEWDGVFEPKGK